jgi:hypothetical protein
MSEVTDPELLKQLDDPQAGDPGRVEGGWKVGNELDLLQGVIQGTIDPVEGIVQLAEKSGNWHLAPQATRDWARNYRKQAQSTMLGMGGEVLGNVAPSLLWPAAGVASAASRALAGTIAGALQPVSGSGDYWRTKRAQALLGGLGGVGLPALAGQAARAGPALATAAGHAAGIPRFILNTMHGVAAPFSNAAQYAARTQGGREGALAGMVRGRNPLEATPQAAAQSAPSAALADDSGVNRSAKGDRLAVTPRQPQTAGKSDRLYISPNRQKAADDTEDNE